MNKQQFTKNSRSTQEKPQRNVLATIGLFTLLGSILYNLSWPFIRGEYGSAWSGFAALLLMLSYTGIPVGLALLIIGLIPKRGNKQDSAQQEVGDKKHARKFLFSKLLLAITIMTVIFVAIITKGFTDWSENGPAVGLWLIVFIAPLYPFLAIAAFLELIEKLMGRR